MYFLFIVRIATTALLVSTFLFGCSSVPKAPSQAKIQARLDVVKDTAISYGTQYALHWESLHINKHLDSKSRQLDGIYNFSQLMLPNNVIPPVLEESFQNVAVGDSRSIRVSDRMIKIVSRAKISTVPPSWRDYIYMNFPKPDEPNERMLPTNAEEKKVWDKGLIEGWEVGLWQAKSIFQANIGLLNRDFEGMVLYYNLVSQNMITPTYSAVAKLGITGNNNLMQLNDRILKITSDSNLQPENYAKWSAAVPVIQNEKDSKITPSSNLQPEVYYK